MRNGILLNDTDEDLYINPVYDASGLIVSGVVIDESDTQNIEQIIKAYRGEYKYYPALGGEIYKQLKGNNPQAYRRFLQIQLQSDGYNLKDVELKINEP